jgi:uncharacterized protein YdaT
MALTMSPLSSSLFTQPHDHGGQSQPGFTRSLMDAIVISRSKIDEWVEMEKAKADAVAEDYRQKLIAEQASIDAQVANLLAVQLERGLSVQNKDKAKINSESIATRKQALEQKQTALEAEIEKLQVEFDKRDKRVKGAYV